MNWAAIPMATIMPKEISIRLPLYLLFTSRMAVNCRRSNEMTAPDIDQSQYSMTTDNHNFYKQSVSVMMNLSLKYLKISCYYTIECIQATRHGKKRQICDKIMALTST